MQIAKNVMTVLVATFVLMATDAFAEDTVYREIQSTEPTTPAPASDVAKDNIYAPPEGPSRAQQQRDARAESRKEAAILADAIAAGCAQRRQIVAQLEPSTRVIVRGEDGENSQRRGR